MLVIYTIQQMKKYTIHRQARAHSQIADQQLNLGPLIFTAKIRNGNEKKIQQDIPARSQLEPVI